MSEKIISDFFSFQFFIGGVWFFYNKVFDQQKQIQSLSFCRWKDNDFIFVILTGIVKLFSSVTFVHH